MIHIEKIIVHAVNAALQDKRVIARKRGNKIILAKSPTINKNRLPSAAQEENINKFKAAAAYGRMAMKDPDLEEIYSEKATMEESAYNRAVRDYLVSPKVKSIDASAYDGKIDSTILVKASDDFLVKEVWVNIFSAEGDLVEEGPATIDPYFRIKWYYNATRNIAKVQGCTIRAVAKDLPGNTGKLEINL